MIVQKKGAFWPSVSSYWTYWAPQTERSRIIGISSAGSRIGNVFGFLIGGYLCAEGFAGGWPSIFYTFGKSIKGFFLILLKKNNNFNLLRNYGSELVSVADGLDCQ